MSEPNPLIGEGEFRGMKLLMDFDTFAALEVASGKKMPRLIVEYEMGLGLSDLVQWLKAFCVDDVSVADVKAAIHQGGMMGDYEAATKVLGELMNAFFDPPKKEKGRRPQKAE